MSYRSVASALDALQPLSWYSWTAGHRPLAGQWDWPSVLLLAIVCGVLLPIGVVAFELVGTELGDRVLASNQDVSGTSRRDRCQTIG